MDMQKFLIVRDSILEVLGVRVNAPPYEFELHGEKFEKSHVFPLVYLLSTVVGSDPIHKMLSSYGDSITKAAQGIDTEVDDDFNNVFDLISQGYEADDIVMEMTGQTIDELIESARKRDEDKEVAQISSTRQELEDARRKIMEETPVTTKKKPIQFTIKTGE